MTKKEAVEIISNQIAEAKAILESAKQVAQENGLGYNLEDMMQDLYTEITGDYPDWYGSSC